MNEAATVSNWVLSPAKRAIDILTAAAVLLFCAPLLVGASVAVRLSSSGPIIFRQERIGLDEQTFEVAKFRTMRAAEGTGEEDTARITPVGGFLRQFGIDELPQLLSVLRGDMSLIGPRPLLPEYLPFYNNQERRRHMVRPGVTGLAQVSGRNALSWSEKFVLDTEYVENASILTDLSIAFRTCRQLLQHSDTNASDTTVAVRLDDVRSPT